MISSDALVCSCTLFTRSDTSVASRKAAMRSCIRAHSSWKGSGVSATRGSENPETVFIARAALASTLAARVCRHGEELATIGRMSSGSGHDAYAADMMPTGSGWRQPPYAYRYRHLGRSCCGSPLGKARISLRLATQGAHSKRHHHHRAFRRPETLEPCASVMHSAALPPAAGNVTGAKT